MNPNPVLKKLGYSDTDRLAIIHTDDIGMCQASVQAFADLQDFGLISSGAVMVPCPWFLEAAAYARAHPEADLGVHLTLTAEWKTYRWGPISTRDAASGLIDEEGYFYAQTAQAIEHGQPAAVQKEITAQVERALASGIQPTHADTHMGVLGSEKFMAGYLQMAVERGLPAMLFRMDEEHWRSAGLTPQAAAMAAYMMRSLEDAGLPMFDRIGMMPLNQPQGQLETAIRLFDSLEPGITYVILHPSVDSPELRAIAPDWESRVANYQTFLSKELRDHIRSSGVQVIGCRDLQKVMPDPQPVLAMIGEIKRAQGQS